MANREGQYRPKMHERSHMKIFEPISVGKLDLKNRLVMAPLLTNLAAPNGEATDELKEHYRKRAEGE